jgi:hypothetical protein
MNEIFVLLDTVADLGWIYACAVIVLTTGLTIFDRAARLDSSTEDGAAELRKAA